VTTTSGGTRRDEILREIGIDVRWRLRGATEAAPVPAAEAAAASPAPRPRSEPVHGPDWAELKAQVASCTACGLHEKRNKTVFGVGDEQADSVRQAHSAPIAAFRLMGKHRIQSGGRGRCGGSGAA
jgi:DNA polymerase